MKVKSIPRVDKTIPVYASIKHTIHTHPAVVWPRDHAGDRVHRLFDNAVRWLAQHDWSGRIGSHAESEDLADVRLASWLVDVPHSLSDHATAMEGLAQAGYHGARPMAKTSQFPLDTMPGPNKVRYDVVHQGLTEGESATLLALTTEPMLHSTKTHRAHMSDLLPGDLQALHDSGIIERCGVPGSPVVPRILLRVFKIAKREKQTGRLLVNGVPFDDVSADVPSPRTPTLSEIESFVRGHMFASVMDFRGWFYQLGVSSIMRHQLGFRARVDGEVNFYRFKIAIPGIKRAPTIAQIVTGGIRRLAGIVESSLAIYDDIIVGGPSGDVVETRVDSFVRACGTARAEIHQGKTQPVSDNVTFDGLDLDLSAKTISLPEKWRIAVGNTHTTPEVLTCRTLAHHLGTWSYSMHAMRAAPAAYPMLILLSMALGQFCTTSRDWETVVRIPLQVIQEFRRFESWLVSVKPRVIRSARKTIHVWSDASETGGAAVVIDEIRQRVLLAKSWTWSGALSGFAIGARSSLSGCKDDDAPIRRLEMVAMLVAMHMALACMPADEFTRIVVFHDNSNVESRHRKWSSPHRCEARALANLRSLTSLRCAHAGTAWVPSALQLADKGTRTDPWF